MILCLHTYRLDMLISLSLSFTGLNTCAGERNLKRHDLVDKLEGKCQGIDVSFTDTIS